MAHESNLAALVEEVKAARLAFEAGHWFFSQSVLSCGQYYSATQAILRKIITETTRSAEPLPARLDADRHARLAKPRKSRAAAIMRAIGCSVSQ
jgi:hypothetical protein